MKILVFSDSHGCTSHMSDIVEKHVRAGGLDRVFFLGDGIRDAINVSNMFPSVKFDCVLGNCDGLVKDTSPLTDVIYEKLVTVGAWRFLLMHGHKYDVKFSYQDAVDHAIEKKADVLFFGHTHRAEDLTLDGTYGDSVRIINPGSCGMGFNPSFALVETVGPELVCGFGIFP